MDALQNNKTWELVYFYLVVRNQWDASGCLRLYLKVMAP